MCADTGLFTVRSIKRYRLGPPRLSAHVGLVDQGFDFRIGGLACLVGFQDRPNILAEHVPCSRQWRRSALLFVQFLQVVEDVFPRHRKCQGISSCPQPVAGHVRLLVQWASFLPVMGMHGQANQGGNARAGTYKLHYRDFLLVDAVDAEACPHVISVA